jgi:hypothetical protein
VYENRKHLAIVRPFPIKQFSVQHDEPVIRFHPHTSFQSTTRLFLSVLLCPAESLSRSSSNIDTAFLPRNMEYRNRMADGTPVLSLYLLFPAIRQIVRNICSVSSIIPLLEYPVELLSAFLAHTNPLNPFGIVKGHIPSAVGNTRLAAAVLANTLPHFFRPFL